MAAPVDPCLRAVGFNVAKVYLNTQVKILNMPLVRFSSIHLFFTILSVYMVPQAVVPRSYLTTFLDAVKRSLPIAIDSNAHHFFGVETNAIPVDKLSTRLLTSTLYFYYTMHLPHFSWDYSTHVALTSSFVTLICLVRQFTKETWTQNIVTISRFWFIIPNLNVLTERIALPLTAKHTGTSLLIRIVTANTTQSFTFSAYEMFEALKDWLRC